jgi:ferredoxin-nitrite reductase
LEQSLLLARSMPGNAVETTKASKGGDPLRIRDDLPHIIARGAAALTKAEKDLLKWIGVFARARTPGKFMLRIRMPNGFATSAQLVAIAELSKSLGNCIVDLTTRQQVELRGFTLESVPDIFERLRRVDLHSLQTGMDNVRNINGCALAGITRGELLDASPIVFELDRRLVGSDGNPEFTNLPRKLNVTITGCLDNCTHAESQDIALVPAVSGERIGFNVLVGGKMGSGGFTIASPLDVFIGPSGAADVVTELIRIYRDHGPRDARGRCRFAFLIEEWGLPRLRAVLTERVGRDLALAGRDARSLRHADHLGITRQPGGELASVGLCVPTGRAAPFELFELARLADDYGAGSLRLTTGQNVIIPNVSLHRVQRLLHEPLLVKFSPSASPFVRGLVTCIGTDFCNLALIDTKGPALALARTLETRLGTTGAPLTMHWSGCQAGCGNHQAADIGLRGHRAAIDGKVVDAVAVYVRGRTGPDAAAGEQILEAVACDALPDVVERLLADRDRIVPFDSERTFSHGSFERPGDTRRGSADSAAEGGAAPGADAA